MTDSAPASTEESALANLENIKREEGRMKRRHFLALSGAAVAGAATGEGPAMPVIDTHAHIYSEDDSSYPPVSQPRRPPGTSGSLAKLETVAKENGVSGVCIVQPSTYYGWDNRYICDTAARTPGWTAGVCTLDPDNPESPALLRSTAKQYGIRALRSIPARDGRLDSPGVDALWRAAGEARLTVNVLCGRNNTDALAHLLERHPRQQVVIDHCLNLKAGTEMEGTVSDMIRLARYPNAHAKLTFLPTGSLEGYPFRDMHEPCRKILAAYSPGRCVWGSNFPCELWTPRSDYRQNLRVFQCELGLDESAQRAILGATAQRLYFQVSHR